MLIRQGANRDELADRHLATSLAAVAGALNAAAFYAVGFFSANMTGNVSLLSDHVAIGDWLGAVLYFGIVLAFILGAASCTLILRVCQRRTFQGSHAFLVLLEAMLVLPLAWIDMMPATQTRVAILVGGLAFIMGLQNAIVTHISEARVRTTHVSGMATDLGMEIAVALDGLRRGRHDQDNGKNSRKILLHGSTMIAFLAGGILGVVVYRHIGALLFAVVSIILVAIATNGLRRLAR